MTLPLVDFANDPDPGASIDAALAGVGFLQLANIGIDPAELDRVFAASEAFFGGPMETKRACGYQSAGANFGYQGVLEESLDPGAPADLKETFTMRNVANAPPPGDRWPSSDFRDTMRGFFATLMASAHAIQRAMARALDVPEEFFTSVHSGQTCTVRLLHYPAAPRRPLDPGQMGAGAHTDYGFLTLLFQRGVGGLQVQERGGGWIDVAPRGDVAVVNCGDLLQQWTNGRYRSTPHRVIPQTGAQDRFSIAMFVDPDSDTLVEALPACVSEANPARWPPVTAGEHLKAKLEATHQGRFTQAG